MDIYPSILEQSAEALLKRLTALTPYFSHFQIDIADGKFVTGKTVQIEEIESRLLNIESSKSFEFHLMVDNWEIEIPKLERFAERLRITCILIHLSVFHSKFYSLRSKFKYGLVLNPEDSVSNHWETIKQFNTVQLMTVHPGAQGTPFVPEALDKIDELRQNGFYGKIILDGAISDKTLPIILRRKNLPDAVCPGSYFSRDVGQRLTLLMKLL